MKKYIFIFVLICTLNFAQACDICGCSNGSLFIGPYHFSGKHFIGTRYSFRNYFSRMADDPTEFSKDHYQTVEVWGGVTINKRWQLMAFIPYNKNLQQTEAHPHTVQGLGDVTLLCNYRIRKQVWIGAGIKLPTGNFDPKFANHPVPSANIQPGTGSVDFIINAADIITLNKFSLHNNINYKLNGSGKQFRFGDRVNISSLLARSFQVNKLSVSPYAGLQYENLGANKLEKEKIEHTGGQALLSTIGMDCSWGKINVGVNMQLPVVQNFADQQTAARWRGMLQVNFIF